MSLPISFIASACCMALSASAVANDKPKNIIYMIGDGMGPAYTTAYRYYKDNPNTKQVETTIFDQILVGMAHTYPDDDTIVTDSAAGATALSTATKSYNGAIAVNTDKAPLTTILQIAKSKNMTTALVATSQINHATPASFAAHNESRRNYNEIADDYLDVKVNNRLSTDLLLGGGTKYFIREDRDLIKEFKDAGYSYSDDFSKINNLKQLPAIGLYAETAFPYAIDQYPNRLETMTAKALSLLSKDNKSGFFAMIEGSQIDWCGHVNDIACAMKEMDDFAKSITLAKQYVDKNPDTLLVITADHSTGGLTLGANGKYLWHADVVKSIKQSVHNLANELYASPNVKQVWNENTDIEISDTELQALKAAKGKDKKSLYKAINTLINNASYTGWTTTGHTAVDVQVFAYGQGYEAFIGSQNNTEIAQKLINYIEK